MAAGVVSRRWGAEAGDEFERDCTRQEQAKRVTAERQATAAAVSSARVRRGDGGELDADRVAANAQQQRRRERKEAKTHHRDGKRAARELRDLEPLLRRRKHDNPREEKAAAELAEKALQDHGIRHHYRPLPKLAWFTAYLAGVSLDRSVALRVLNQINMPAGRMAEVIEAAYSPRGYTPRRNVCTGGRASQQPYQFDGRTLGGKLWADGERAEDHPGAIRVLQCAVFLWLAKGRTSRRGYSYKVRGFGLGVFASMCRCSPEAISGHTRGMPGALRALAQSGFIEYGQPPSEKVSAFDRGPSGHAYNVFWFRRGPAELALDAMHARTARLACLPLVERLLLDPTLIEPMARPPPPVIDTAQIPF